MLALGVTVVLAIAGCTGDTSSNAVSGGGPSETIPQPPVEGVPVAPESERVDLNLPSFSNPTDVTNPLFPVSRQESVLLLGHVDGPSPSEPRSPCSPTPGSSSGRASAWRRSSRNTSRTSGG